MNKYLLSLLCCTFFLSCLRPVYMKDGFPDNPRSYTYTKGLEDVKNAIKEGFSKYQFRTMKLDSMHKVSINGKNYLKSALDIIEPASDSNTNDFILYSESSIGYSKMFFTKRMDSLLYYAGFRLHLNVIDANHVQVRIITIKPAVETSKHIITAGPCGAYKTSQTRYVEPSSIEEYEILLIIGKKLGIQGMPSLVLPNSANTGKLIRYKQKK